MEFNSKTRTKMIKARVSEEEKILIETKAKNYGYRNISDYLRDAAIYEKVTYVDLKNRQLIYNAYSDNTKVLKEIIKEIRHICTFATQIDNLEVTKLRNLMWQIINNQKSMIKLIDNKLDLDIWQKINRNK